MSDTNLSMRDEADPLAKPANAEGSSIFVDLEGRDSSNGPEPSAGFGGGGRFSNPAIIAVVLVALSGGAIYGMRRVGIVSGISSKTLSVEYQPSAINTEFEDRFDQAMDDLARSGRPLQVALDELPSRPFEIDQRLNLGSQVISEVDEAALSEAARLRLQQQRAEEERRRLAALASRIDTEVARLKIQSMIGGRVPVATINGQLCRIGDEVGNGIFTVDFISGEGVTVVANGRKFLVPLGGSPRELFE